MNKLTQIIKSIFKKPVKPATLKIYPASYAKFKLSQEYSEGAEVNHHDLLALAIAHAWSEAAVENGAAQKVIVDALNYFVAQAAQGNVDGVEANVREDNAGDS